MRRYARTGLAWPGYLDNSSVLSGTLDRDMATFNSLAWLDSEESHIHCKTMCREFGRRWRQIEGVGVTFWNSRFPT
jgi:hypothetical protein